MNVVAAGALRRVFRGSAESSYREMLVRHQLAERERRERKEEVEDDSASDELDFAIAMISVAEAHEFRAELDLYDTATVAALQENERALALVQGRMDQLLAKAYVLPDGRRVFKTDDGSQVFDEFGKELEPNEIDPAMIDDAKPTWETYKPELEARDRLVEERRSLLDYQAKVDDARERLDRGDMTRKEFEELREELKAEMPEAVRDQLPEMEREPQQSEDASAAPAGVELSIADDMVPTSSAPKAFIPT